MKTDIPVEDTVLRGLREGNRKEAYRRCDTLLKAVQEVLEEPVKSVTPGDAQGTFHLIHHVVLESGEQLIARSTVPEIFERDDGMLIDPYAQRRLSAAGLPALRTHVLDLSRRLAPFEFMLSDPARGKSLTAIGDAAMDEPERLAAIGEAMSKWHSIPASGAGLLDTEWLEKNLLEKGRGNPRGVHESWDAYLMCNLDFHLYRCESLGYLDSRTAQQIYDWFSNYAGECAAQPSCLLHGDAGNHNIFMEDGEVSAVVDWEDALAGDPIYDIAFWATFHPTRRWEAFLHGYGIDEPSAPEFTIPFTLYFLRVTLAKLVHRQRFGYRDVPGRPSAAERLSHAIRLVKEAL